MPNTSRRRARDIRMKYTGEDNLSANQGVGRHGIHGLDHCTPSQSRFRALLALNLFNSSWSGPNPNGVLDKSVFLLYTMVISPRYDVMVFIVPGAMDNAVGRLMSSRFYLDNGVPGLRLVSDTSKAIQLVHLATGARMQVVHNSVYARTFPESGLSGRWVTEWWPTLDVPLSREEKQALHRIPAMTVEIEILLGGLVSRLDVHDPDGTWDIGMWNWDRLDREKPDNFGSHQMRYRTLWGSGHRWTLRWNGHPPMEDVVACLTDRQIGIDGAYAANTQAGVEIRLGSSALELQYGPPPEELRRAAISAGRRG